MAEENTPESGASSTDPELGASEPPPANADTPTTPLASNAVATSNSGSAVGKSVPLTPGQRLAAKKAQKAVEKREFKEELKRSEEESRLKEQEEADRLLGRARPEPELPAEVEQAARTFSDFVQDHRGRILGGLAAGLAIAAVAFGAQRFMRSGAAEQAEQLGRALEIANAGIDPDDTDGSTDDGKPVFKTEQERANKALAAFDKVAQGEDDAAATWAKLAAAAAETQLGKFAEARKRFQAVYDAHRKEPQLAARALEGVGLSYEGEAKPDEALKAYEQLKSIEGSKELSEYHVARIKLAKGDREGGKTLLKALYDQLSAPGEGAAPSRYLKSEVEVRLAEIDSKLVDKGSSIDGDTPQQFSEEQMQRLIEQLQKKGAAGGATPE
jgi:hypothetical protein